MIDWIFGKTGGKSIKEYQLDKINKTLELVLEKSVFYKQYYRDYDIQSINSFEDFEKLPFTTAEDLTDFGKQMLCVPQNEIERIVTLQTSGTTEEPKRVWFTSEDQELTVDFFDNGMRCLVNEGDNVLILLPYKTPGSVGDLLRQGLERLGCGVFPYGLIDDYSDACKFMINNKITSLVGNPVQVLKLAEFAKMSRLDIQLNSILLSTDYVPDAIVKRVANLWKCKVFEHYGMTEMCFGGGVYCEFLTGYHMREADLYFEIVSDKGETLPDGEYGEVVFTTLTRTGMPLIRYKTGDYGRFIKEHCACSSDLRVMEKIRRRVDGGVQVEGKEFFVSDFDEIYFSDEKVVDYTVEIVNEKINTRITTINDIMKTNGQQNRLDKRQIIIGGTNGTKN